MRLCSRTLLSLIALLTVCGVSAPARQNDSAPKDDPSVVKVRGVGPKETTLTVADLENLPHKSVQVNEKSGDKVVYEGVTLAEALKKAGMDFAANQHGRGLTRYLLVEAADKYRVVFALPEIDPDFTDRLVLLATKRDGKAIANETGPMRLVVPDEKRQARWVRQVRLLTLVDAVPAAERNQKP